ncbi:MAG TPA: DNRLRE domain-containing protein, partial [Acidobacteriaceae bacterium]|nr:DNRLRE domain-containing protein [Acidobacteriaceae bacterium]
MSQRSWKNLLAFGLCVMSGLATAHATQATVSGDTYVNAALPSVNFGRLSNMYVNSNGTALIQYDLSSLPAGTTAAQIGKATLTIFVNRINAAGPISVQPVLGAWSESVVTYSTIPSLGSAIATFTPTADQQFVTVDITSLVQSWLTTPSTNFGIALTSATGNVVLDSKENDETSHVSSLNMTVVSQGPQGPQ